MIWFLHSTKSQFWNNYIFWGVNCFLLTVLMYALRLNTSLWMNIDQTQHSQSLISIEKSMFVVRGTGTPGGRTLQVKDNVLPHSTSNCANYHCYAVLVSTHPSYMYWGHFFYRYLFQFCYSQGGRTPQVFGDVTNIIFGHALKSVTLVW